MKKSMYYGADVIVFQNAKRLRNNLTSSEKKLWEQLSHNKLGVRFKAQHPISNFIVDFYCHSAKVIIEIDGDSHFAQEALENDSNRTEELERLGLKVIRFTNEQIRYSKAFMRCFLS
jgi:imidazole glycerol-phosphate synthase subunit HisF